MAFTAALGKQQAKSLRAKDLICEATIELLMTNGYSETSLNQVASMAGFSKGALQHHYPSKEDLIAATLNKLLARPFQPPREQPRSVEQALLIAWNKYSMPPEHNRCYKPEYRTSLCSGGGPSMVNRWPSTRQSLAMMKTS
jgi:AcrR family transcriptional regulator